MNAPHRIIFSQPPMPVRYKSRVSQGIEEPLVKLEGIDAQRRVKVWARNKPTQPFRQVGAMKYDLAEYFRKLMLSDESERRRAIRDAHGMIWDQ